MADAQKTEQPSQQRLKKAREEGNFASSRHFISGAQFLVAVTLLKFFGHKWVGTLRLAMHTTLARAFGSDLTPNDWLVLLRTLTLRCGGPLIIAGAVLVVITVSLQLGLTRMGFSFKKLTPDFNRLNPANKLKNLWHQALPSLLQAVVLLPIAGYVVYAVGFENKDRLLALPLKSLDASQTDVADSLMTLLWRAAAVFFVFGCVDLFREQRRFTNELRMTKQEVKEERKQMEGDPHTKMRIRRIQRDQARKRMMQAVPKATAVIVNPTHFSVAIKYEPDTMRAPVVVAKGKNYLAARIRQLAVENQVPLVENPPLARGLYKAVDIGGEIPPHLYKAVAEILAYIFRLMNRRL
jgi:flagellar biosynthetic protein FlhB